jgi:hypothetical protein
VIAISGVYRIPAGKVGVRLGGSDPVSFRVDEVAPFRTESAPGPAARADSGVPLRVNAFGPAFGNDPDVREEASPICHVCAGLPPFLIFSAEHDLPTLPEMAQEFHKALGDHDCHSQLVRVEGRNHNSIVFMAVTDGDPVGHGMVEFVRSHCQ